MNWKKILADVVKVVSGAFVAWLATGCATVPMFVF